MIACAPRRLENVAIPIREGAPNQAITTLSQAVGYRRHIRSLNVVNPAWFTRPHPEEKRNCMGYEIDYSIEYEYGDRSPWSHANHYHPASILPEPLPEPAIIRLLHFLRQLERLTDLIWACQERIPARIVKHVEDIGCRLHIKDFWLESITTAEGGPVTLTGEDLQLVTSPALTSLSRLGGDRLGNDDHFSAILNMLQAAPNLTEVCLASKRYKDPRASAPRMGRTHNLIVQNPSSWQWSTGLIPIATDKGRLRRFELHSDISETGFEWLNNYTDCNSLRCLRIHTDLAASGIAWLANYADLFGNLRDLKLGACEYQDSLVSFVTLLPSLCGLQLDQVSCTTLETIVKSCGSRLKRLYCVQTFVGRRLLCTLFDCCQDLEELGIGIYRRQGSVSELTTYRHLAYFPQLRRLHLALRSSKFRESAAELSELKAEEDAMDVSNFDSEELDEAYLACRDLACDQALGTAVFEYISRQKAAYTPRLESLILEPSWRVGEYIPMQWPYHLHQLLESVALAWKCTSSRRDDSLHSCNVTAFGQRPYPPEGAVREMDTNGLTYFGPVIHRLWPESQQMNSFANLWHSFPIGEEPG